MLNMQLLRSYLYIFFLLPPLFFSFLVTCLSESFGLFFKRAQPPKPVTKWDPLKCCHFFLLLGGGLPLYIGERSTAAHPVSNVSYL